MPDVHCMPHDIHEYAIQINDDNPLDDWCTPSNEQQLQSAGPSDYDLRQLKDAHRNKTHFNFCNAMRCGGACRTRDKDTMNDADDLVVVFAFNFMYILCWRKQTTNEIFSIQNDRDIAFMSYLRLCKFANERRRRRRRWWSRLLEVLKRTQINAIKLRRLNSARRYFISCASSDENSMRDTTPITPIAQTENNL